MFYGENVTHPYRNFGQDSGNTIFDYKNDSFAGDYSILLGLDPEGDFGIYLNTRRV
jgi:hypothetical protein